MSVNSYGKPDFWSQKAFSEGYPARSVYKLQEIDKKFSLFKKNQKVLDLGAAPGSWTLFVLRTLEQTGFVTAIDLQSLEKTIKADNLAIITGDLYADNVREEAKKYGLYDVVICDAAPATTGNKIVDTARSTGLVELAIYYAQTMLKQDGAFVVKIFQGSDQQHILKQLRALFSVIKIFKPQACRSESVETYIVGLRKSK
ncbi:MAG: SAM-dependent methyltransferase [Treponemataceae bacterium]